MLKDRITNGVWEREDVFEQELPVSNPLPTSLYYSNRYNARAACEHCEGIIRHEAWCITRDPLLYYAYQVVADPSKLTVGDSLILHSLGVLWQKNPCEGKCDRKS
jgi:hypothetical protein